MGRTGRAKYMEGSFLTNWTRGWGGEGGGEKVGDSGGGEVEGEMFRISGF